jgi:hypothetical protein
MIQSRVSSNDTTRLEFKERNRVWKGASALFRGTLKTPQGRTYHHELPEPLAITISREV